MVSIILVNYGCFQDSLEAIESLKKQKTQYDYKIILVDNCSKDDSYEKLKKKYTSDEMVDIVLSDKNGGFSYGNNFGINYAIDKYNSKYFLLINNDTISNEDIIQKFVDYFIKNKEKNIGILTGKIYYYSEPNNFWFAGGRLDKKRAGGVHLGVNESDSGQYNEEMEIDFATGCLMFFNKKLLQDIGYLPEEYFMYFEDVDFSWATINKNKKIIYLPEIKIWHKVGKSSNLLQSKNSYRLFNRNRLILAKKYMGKFKFYKFRIFMYCRSFIKCILHLVKNKEFVNTFEGL
ncbi:glycosyltransferase family 2 protein (plasmid) [Cetobacterium somerae]|uniref:glycosyltransferase family 2 protein n=1 Tax=Cetobacterium somerae TaxID=188913 RepID=UPI003D768AFD